MAIKFVNVNYKNIFKKLNLEIKENEIISIVGKNGSGKTCFLNLIFGLDLTFEGEIFVNKRSLSSKIRGKELNMIRKNIFYLIQDYHKKLFNINVFEDIKYGISNLSIDKLYELLKLFDLDKEILNKNYIELSDGEIKRILIIKMFIRNSKIILLDDPTSGLDQKSVSTLIKLLKKEKRTEKSIIICSQDSEFLFSISDRIVILDNEKLIECNNKYDFFANKKLLNKCELTMPKVLQFRENTLKRKNIKLIYRDNINDLIKDIYRYAK